MNKLFWKLRWPIFGFAILSIILVISSTFFLYCYYGPLTPNGNRYWHPFSTDTVQWSLVLWSAIAFLILAYPSLRLPFSHNPSWHKWGLFPSRNTASNIISIILTLLNISSGFIFCVLMTIQTVIYIHESDRVMAEDLETVLISFAYLLCTIFWSIVLIIYSFCFKLKW